ncbi:MAG: hypothetical protein AB7G93_21125 [Bdellovibrionales bacterium]
MKRANRRGYSKQSIGVLISTFGLLLAFQNCAPQRFSSIPENSAQGSGSPLGPGPRLGNSDNNATGVITQTGGPNCRRQLESSTLPIKPIFVVDVSGSNSRQRNGRGGTDPDKAMRGGAMQRFFNTYSSRVNFQWSLARFARSTAIVEVSNDDASVMQEGLDKFMDVKDRGNTPYKAALDAIKDVIVNDARRTNETKYIVIFLSDGMPNPRIDDDDLKTAIQGILNTAPGQVSLNTVYYGGENADASGRLRMMAQEGGGNFLDTNVNPTGTAFLVSDLVVIPGAVCD